MLDGFTGLAIRWSRTWHGITTTSSDVKHEERVALKLLSIFRPYVVQLDSDSLNDSWIETHACALTDVLVVRLL